LNKQLSYKYINLLFRLLIGIAAIVYIFIKIKSTYVDYIIHFSLNDIRYPMLILAVLLLFLNWGLEAYKWKFSIKDVETISFFKSLKLVLTSVTIGLLTPNRIGEIPSRVFLLGNKKELKKLIIRTSYGAYAQVLATLLFGSIGLYITSDYFTEISFMYTFILGCFSVSVFIFFLYFNPLIFKSVMDKIPFIRKKRILNSAFDLTTSFLVKIFVISVLRYLVFSIQYYLVLMAFNIELNHQFDFFLIAVCFMVGSFIPTILLSEIGVRGGVALFIYGVISDLHIAIVLASITLWFINVAFPACIGTFSLNQFKLYTK